MSHPGESVEDLVKRFGMDPPAMFRDHRSPTCSVFDCWSVKQRRESPAMRRISRHLGIEHSQPHLVEPMKLTVYDQLPMTPLGPQHPSRISRLVTQGRRSMSRASTRASTSLQTRSRSKPSISRPPAPQAPQATLSAPATTLRRKPSFRPIQLSIYMEDNRLSDLPEFDAWSFTDDGEIKMPPRAVLRAQSLDCQRGQSPTLPGLVHEKPASMFEQSFSRRMSHVRNPTDSTVLSASRPPSEYDALHSHPVSWLAAPGVPPQLQFASAPFLSKKVLSPMREEFTPPPSGAVIINGTILAFPEVDATRVNTEFAHRSLLPPAPGREDDCAAPSPVIDPGPNRRTTIITQHKSKASEAASIMLASSADSTRTRAATPDLSQISDKPIPPVELPVEEPRTYFHTDYKTNTRIKQWLDNDKTEKARSRESSISTIRTTSTTSSFAEHRRKRNQFYQLNHPKQNADGTPATTKVSKPPAPLALPKSFPPQKALAGPTASEQPASRIQPNHTHTRSKSSVSIRGQSHDHNHSRNHNRTMTDSTVASTVATDVLFEQPETPQMDRESRDEFDFTRLPPSHILHNPVLASMRRREIDAESMTTIDMKSRTGTMRSTVTSNPRGTPEPQIMYPEKENSAGVEAVSSAQTPFDFSRKMTPSPAALSVRSEGSTGSVGTPLSAKEADVERMVFDMCKSSGYRRVNVGMAF